MTILFRESSDIDFLMLEIKLFASEHISEIAKIERFCFSEPWSENAFSIFLGDNAFGVVALLDGAVVAYGGMLCVLDEGQITNIATHPDHRRKGLGRAIVNALEEEAERRGLSILFLEVREHNSVARELYASCGWKEIGIRKNFYSKPVDNAVLMKKEILKGS